MEIILTLISIDIIAAKFLNSYISYYRFKGTQDKRKSIFGRFLEKAGFKNDTWPSFYLTFILVIAMTYFFHNYYAAPSMQLLYVFTGLFTIVLNLGSAHSSYFGRENFITERMLQ
ncbi:hypothetical protein [Salinimicrobium sp. GXAS 041]|uniref:hypothetical protein n=1 Tax=Salinimicrobium sp. GXAS 041 TaxID=3400806 RepID=UPI003C718AFA